MCLPFVQGPRLRKENVWNLEFLLPSDIPSQESNTLKGDSRFVRQEFAVKGTPDILANLRFIICFLFFEAIAVVMECLISKCVKANSIYRIFQETSRYFKDQIAGQNVLIRVFEIPCKEGGFLTSIGKGKHLPSFLWKPLVERGCNHGMRTVRAMYHLSHRVRTTVSTGTTFWNLVFPLFRTFLLLHEDRFEVLTYWFVLSSFDLGHCTALDAESKYFLFGRVILFIFSFINTFLNKSEESRSKVRMSRVAYGLLQRSVPESSNKVVLTTFSTEGNLKDRSFFNFAAPFKKYTLLWKVRHEGTFERPEKKMVTCRKERCAR
ncbi:hypothetical protein ES703_92629 [subsurface metagenome]